jgi:hypothetical protein
MAQSILDAQLTLISCGISWQSSKLIRVTFGFGCAACPVGVGMVTSTGTLSPPPLTTCGRHSQTFSRLSFRHNRQGQGKTCPFFLCILPLCDLYKFVLFPWLVIVQCAHVQDAQKGLARVLLFRHFAIMQLVQKAAPGVVSDLCILTNRQGWGGYFIHTV